MSVARIDKQNPPRHFGGYPKCLCNAVTVLSPLVLYDCDDPVRFKLLNNGVTVLTIEPYFIREQTIESQQLPAEAGLLGNSS